MCWAIPALIRSMEGYQAEVEVGGVKRVVSLQLVPQVKIDDYVLIRYAISVVDEEEAQETFRLLAEFTDSDEIP